jgi:chemotaxis family two-component system sensor kinase Cph1
MAKPQRFRCGDHICAIYSDAHELADLASAFLAEGLTNGERCWYVAAGKESAAVSGALTRRGVHVQSDTRRGALSIFAGSDAYVKRGGFDPEQTIRVFNDAIEDALKDGFSGFRAAADMSWALQFPNGSQLIIAYEAMLRSLFETSRVAGLCLYDRQRMPLQVLNGALMTHPIVGVNGDFDKNPFYDATVTSLREADDQSVLTNLSMLDRKNGRHPRPEPSCG